MKDITIEILKDIRTNTREMRERLDQTVEAVGETNQRVDALARRLVESEIRTATAITEVATDIRDIKHMLRAQNDLRPRVERCEAEIAEIKKRVPAA
jgi:methyl-accepting chemotaxis protein